MFKHFTILVFCLLIVIAIINTIKFQKQITTPITNSVVHYSHHEVFIPDMAIGGDKEMKDIASNIVLMNDVMWNGNEFVIFNKDVDNRITLTTKLVSNWYYKAFSSKKYPVMGKYVVGNFDIDKCTGGIVEQKTILLDANWCGNHWHAIHDNIMPLMSALGGEKMTQWDPDNVNVIYYKHKCKSILFTDVITTRPVLLLNDIKPNTCFKSIQLNGDQKLNMYLRPTDERCKRFKHWVQIYTRHYDDNTIPNNKIQVRWIARNGSRQVMNRNDVIKYLKNSIPNIDIEIVKLEDMSITEQINVFRHSDVIIGPHGAGLAKVMFMKPNAIFFQLMPYGMGKNQVSPYWIFNDGYEWYKGDNFFNSAKCAGTRYIQYDTEFNDSGWANYKETLPANFKNPKQLWGKPDTIANYVTTNKNTKSGIANHWYVAKKESFFNVNPERITNMLLTLL